MIDVKIQSLDIDFVIYYFCILHEFILNICTVQCASFVVYGINSILYQRGVYAPETFSRTQNFGLTLWISSDDKLKQYLSEVLSQVKGNA